MQQIVKEDEILHQNTNSPCSIGFHVFFSVFPHKAHAFILEGHCYDYYCCVENLGGFPEKLNHCIISVFVLMQDKSHGAVPASSSAILYLEYITAIIAEGVLLTAIMAVTVMEW